MRTVGVAAAAVLVMTFYLWHEPQYRKLLLVAGAALLIGAVVGIRLKNIVTDTVYAAADAEKMAVNDYAGKLQVLKAVLTLKGIKQFMRGVPGGSL